MVEDVRGPLEWRVHVPLSFTTSVHGDIRCFEKLGVWRMIGLELEWPAGVRPFHISLKELFAGLVSGTVWGKQWRGSRMQWLCDTQPAVHAVSKDPAVTRT